jgi:hypothetical protein
MQSRQVSRQGALDTEDDPILASEDPSGFDKNKCSTGVARLHTPHSTLLQTTFFSLFTVACCGFQGQVGMEKNE